MTSVNVDGNHSVALYDRDTPGIGFCGVLKGRGKMLGVGTT